MGPDHEILGKSYDLAENFAELNAFIFAKICDEIFDIHPMFFFYSDMQKKKLFVDESQKILQNVSMFNQMYNRVIKENGVPYPQVAEHHVPFWYHCDCGGKVNLYFEDSASCGVSAPSVIKIITCPLIRVIPTSIRIMTTWILTLYQEMLSCRKGSEIPCLYREWGVVTVWSDRTSHFPESQVSYPDFTGLAVKRLLPGDDSRICTSETGDRYFRFTSGDFLTPR